METKTGSTQLNHPHANAKVISNQINSITIDVLEPAICSGCAQSEGCSHRRVQNYLKNSTQITLNTNDIFTIGEDIDLSIDESFLLQSTFYLYCIPLFFLFLGAGLTMLFVNNELLIFIFSIISMIIGFLISSKLAYEKERNILNVIKITKAKK